MTTQSTPQNNGKTESGKDGKAKAQPDVMPEPIDDAPEGDVEVEAGAEPEAAPQDESGKEPVRPQLVEDEGRASAVRRYREIRDREIAEAREAEQGKTQPQQEAQPEGEPHENAPETTNQEPTAAAPTQAGEPAPTKPVEGQEAAAKVKIVVNGREEFLPLDEVVRRAQLSTATVEKLDEAKSLFNEVKALRAQPANPPAAAASPQQTDPSRDQPDAANQRVAGLDPDKLKGIVERIQIGDTDEGAEALGQLVELVKAADGSKTPSVDADQVGRIVQQQIVKTQAEGEMLAALNRFTEKNPAIATNKYLGNVGGEILRENIIADLKANGATDEAIAPIRGNTHMLALAIANAKRAGQAVRSFDKLLDDTGEIMRKEFGIAIAKTEATPAPAQPEAAKQPSQSNPPAQRTTIGTPSEIQARVEKKRAMPSQPRPAGVRAATPPPPRPKTAHEIVQEMRRARNFPTN